jgi:hypothetical protein
MDALRRFFRLFDEGAVFKWILVSLFVLEALLLLIHSLRRAYGLLRTLGEARFLDGLAAVILALAVLLGLLLALLVLLYRGAFEVASLRSQNYSVLSLFAKSLRVNGEAALFFLVVLAPAGCLAIWLSSGALSGFLPFAPILFSSSTFLAGLVALVGGILHALLFVFVAYLAAEICDWLPAVAADIATIRASKTR